jgi:hypothetical protein
VLLIYDGPVAASGIGSERAQNLALMMAVGWESKLLLTCDDHQGECMAELNMSELRMVQLPVDLCVAVEEKYDHAFGSVARARCAAPWPLLAAELTAQI